MNFKKQVKVEFDLVKAVEVCIKPANLKEYMDAFLRVHNFCRDDKEVVAVKNQYGTNNIFIYFVYDTVADFTETDEKSWREFVARCEEWSAQFAPVQWVEEHDDFYYSFEDDLLITNAYAYNW